MQSPGARRFVNGMVERLKTLPGVTAAAASSYAPVVGRGTGAWFNIVARPLPPGTTPPVSPIASSRASTSGRCRFHSSAGGC